MKSDARFGIADAVVLSSLLLIAIIAEPVAAATTFILSGSADGKDPISVNDDLDVYLNGTQIYTDGVVLADLRPPISIVANPLPPLP